MKLVLITKALGDILFIHLAYLAAFYLRYGEFPEYNVHAYLSIAPWLTVAALLLFYFYGSYSEVSARQSWDEIISALICSLALLFLITMTLSYVLYEFAFPRLVIFLSTLIQLVFLYIWRTAIQRWSQRYIEPLCLLIIGSGRDALETARKFVAEDPRLYHIAGILVDRCCHAEDDEITWPVIESFSRLPEAVVKFQPNSVIICNEIPDKERLAILTEVLSRGLQVFVVPDLYEILLFKSRVEQINHLPVLKLLNFVNGRAVGWKRAMDFLLTLLFGIPAVIIIFLAAMALKIESSRHPVFFRQERVGFGGAAFKLLKLRTMEPDAEKSTGPVLFDENDDRVTPVGRFLRATRIDELPQLWNVLIGEMSLIGPRPERPYFVKNFSKQIEGYDYRHLAKSGITGLAQIEGKYSTSPEDKLRFDLIYLQTLSPTKDLQILLHTIKVMLMKDKAL